MLLWAVWFGPLSWRHIRTAPTKLVEDPPFWPAGFLTSIEHKSAMATGKSHMKCCVVGCKELQRATQILPFSPNRGKQKSCVAWFHFWWPYPCNNRQEYCGLCKPLYRRLLWKPRTVHSWIRQHTSFDGGLCTYCPCQVSSWRCKYFKKIEFRVSVAVKHELACSYFAI